MRIFSISTGVLLNIAQQLKWSSAVPELSDHKMFKNLEGVFYQVLKKYKRDGQVLYTLIIKQNCGLERPKLFL